MNDYKDIINLDKPEILNRKKMDIQNRVAQFLPFSALDGYSDLIKEKKEIFIKKINLTDEYINNLNDILLYIDNYLVNKEKINVTYFILKKEPDSGIYQKKIEIIKKIDNLNQKIIFKDNTIIKFDDIFKIDLVI